MLFAAILEEAVDGGPLAIAHHLTYHGQLFAEPGREPRLDANLFARLGIQSRRRTQNLIRFTLDSREREHTWR